MRRLAPFALLLLPTPSTAQSGERPAIPETDQPQVQETDKHEGIAFYLELAVPVLGHAYAGDAGRGVVPAVVAVGGVGMVALSSRSVDTATGFDEFIEALALGLLGVTAGVGGKIWGLASAVDTARDHNRRLQEHVSPTLGLTPDGRASIGLSLRF